MENTSAVICERVDKTEKVLENSTIDICELCTATVWVSPSTKEELKNRKFSCVCIECLPVFFKREEDIEVMPPTRKQLEELLNGRLVDYC